MPSPTNKQLARGLRRVGKAAWSVTGACYRTAERLDPRPPEPEPVDLEALADAEADLVARSRARAAAEAAAKAKSKAKAKPKPECSYSAVNDLLREALSNNQQSPAMA